MSRLFSEDSRVKFPTIMHLVQMGYEYVSLKGVKKYDVPAVEFDPLTNILIKQFTEAFLSLNPDLEESDALKKLKDIQDSLSNDDLGIWSCSILLFIFVTRFVIIVLKAKKNRE